MLERLGWPVNRAAAGTGATVNYGNTEETGSGIGEYVKLVGIQDHEATQKGSKSKGCSFSYKFNADDFNDSRKYLNFVVFADHTSGGTDTMSFNTAGGMTVTQIRGHLSD